MTGLVTDRSQRQARTKTTDSIINAFKTSNSRLNAYFIAAGVNKEDVYSEFFPQGIHAFTSGVRKENVEQLMKNILTAVTDIRL